MRRVTRVQIRVDGEVSDALTGRFPFLHAHLHPATTTLDGEVEDQEAVLGILNHLTRAGVAIVELHTVPG